MNTPAHLVLNLAALDRGERSAGWAVTAGALLPDVPMFAFYLYQRLVLATPERVIWGEAYFRPHWQDFFDVFNSMPLAAAGALVALALRRRTAVLFFASVLLHCGFDLALHHDDAHRHFLPLTDWRFESPVSYWDPAHNGSWGALAELAVVLGGSAVLWRRHPRRSPRITLALVCSLYAAGYAFIYAAGYGVPPPG